MSDVTFPIPTSPEVCRKIMSVVTELSGSFTRQEAERDYQKTAIKALADETQIPAKMLRRFAKGWHTSKIHDTVAEAGEFQTLAAALLPEEIEG